MATNITTQPNPTAATDSTDYIHPTHKPRGIFYKVTSNTANIIKIRAQITIDGVNVISLDKDPTLATISLASKIFEFEISKIVQDYLSYNLQQSAIATAAAPNADVTVVIDVFEITSVGGVVTVAGASSDTSNEILATNIARQYSDDIATTFGAKYVLFDTQTSVLFLTGQETPKEIGTNEQETITVLRNRVFGIGDTYGITFIQLDASGTPIQTDIKGIADAVLYKDIGVGTRNLVTWGITLLPNAVSYTIQVFFNSVTSDIRTFNIVSRTCDATRFHYLSPFGRFESITFEAGKISATQASTRVFQKYLHPEYTVGDRGYEQGRQIAQELFTATLDLRGRTTILNLRNLFLSQQVFIETTDESGNPLFLPVIVSNKEGWKFDINNPERITIEYYIAQDIQING